MITDVILDVEPESIPAALRKRDLWIGWSAEERAKESGETYSTKVPRDALTGRTCDATDPESGASFETALAAYEDGQFGGIGIMLHDGWGLVGVDEDDCRDPETGEIDRDASTRMRMLNSYTEVSPSGTGLRTFAFGEKPGSRCKDPTKGFEMYAETRFLTVTGHHVQDTPQTVEERPGELASVYRLVFGTGEEEADGEGRRQPVVPNDVDDRELVEKAKSSNDGFAALWAGDLSAYGGDHSSADLALCSHLAFWTGRDERRIDALVRQSGLMREKWNRDDYRERTIQKAVASCDDVYEPASSKRSANGHAEGGADDDREEDEGVPQFWSISEKGKVKINLSDEIDWLDAHGFFKTYEFDRDTSTKIEQKGGLIRRRSEEEIRDYLLDHLRKHAPRSVRTKVESAANHYLSTKVFDSLRARNVETLRDTKTSAYFPYRNGVMRVTPEEKMLLSYSDLDVPVWRDAVLPRKAKQLKKEAPLGEFGRFQQKAMKGDRNRLRSLMSVMGYLVHSYKNPAHARAVILMDEEISHDAVGRTGKGLSMRGCAKMTPTEHIDARRIDLRNRFSLQSVKPGITRLVHFNDAAEGFPFQKLYTSVTDDMAVERKNRDRVVIPFDKSPKLAVSTNYVISGRGGSHEGRVFEVEFGNYFNKGHSPEDEFGHLFFQEWDERQWRLFDNYMFECAQLYLREGLIPYEQVNLAWKKFVQDTSPEFADWVQNFGLEANDPSTPPRARQRYKKHALIDSFEEDQGIAVETTNRFTRDLKAYAEYRDVEFKDRLGSGRERLEFLKKQ